MDIKDLVKQKYSEIALQSKESNQSSCCGASGCSTEVYNIMSEDYTQLAGYNTDADLGLGCGLPTQFADIVLEGTLPDGIQHAAEMYAGCVSGAIQKQEYMDLIKESGFVNVIIQKQKSIFIPDDILIKHLSNEQIAAFRTSETGIYSITVCAEKKPI